MAYFEPAVITRTGVNLIANDIAGIGNIEFVKMVSGAGEYTEEEKSKNALAERTALKDQRQEFVFNAIEVKSEKSVLLKSVISNQMLEEGYRITEVGIYAREKGTEGEGSLYSIALAIEADFLPPFNGLNPSEIVQEYYATVSDAATVSIVSAPGALALHEDLKTLESFLKDKIDGINCIISDSDITYDKDSTYVLGKYCIHNGQTYKCIIPIEEPEEWNEGHWEETTIIKELLILNNKEVEVVDPMTTTEEGFAADAKLTGDALREVSANIDSVFQSVSSGKASVASAITAKGVTTNADATFATMAANIGKIVVSPKALSGNKSIGTVAQKASVTATINFSTAFATTPTVIATARGYINGTTTWQTLGCTVSSKSKSGFTVSLSNSTSYALTSAIVEWTANA